LQTLEAQSQPLDKILEFFGQELQLLPLLNLDEESAKTNQLEPSTVGAAVLLLQVAESMVERFTEDSLA
jgi:hypothetical protein